MLFGLLRPMPAAKETQDELIELLKKANADQARRLEVLSIRYKQAVSAKEVAEDQSHRRDQQLIRVNQLLAKDIATLGTDLEEALGTAAHLRWLSGRLRAQRNDARESAEERKGRYHRAERELALTQAKLKLVEEELSRCRKA